MFSDLSKGQRVFMYIMIGLGVIALGISIFVGYNLALVAKPWTIGVTYADKLTYSENQAPIINVKINGNDNNNGLAVYDMQFNSYTDADGNGVTGFGIQCIGDWHVYNSSNITEYNWLANIKEFASLATSSRYKYYKNTYVFGDFYLYATSDNGTTYHQLNESMLDDYMLIDIDGAFYKISLKEYSYETSEDYTGLEAWKNIYKSKKVIKTTKFTWFEVFDAVMTASINNSGKESYSNYPLALFDLSQFITIEYLDKGQYKEMAKTAENRNYMSIPVEYTKDGATDSTDSLFKMVKCNSSWSYYDNTEVEDFWGVATVLNVTEAHVDTIVDGVKVYITIDETFAKYLSGLTGVEISVNINLDNFDYDITGIYMNNFTFKVEEFNIISSQEQDFEVLNVKNVTPTLKLGGVNE